MPQQGFFYEFGYLPLVVPEKEKKGKKKNKNLYHDFDPSVKRENACGTKINYLAPSTTKRVLVTLSMSSTNDFTNQEKYGTIYIQW